MKALHWPVSFDDVDYEVILHPTGEGILRDLNAYMRSLRNKDRALALLSAVFEEGTQPHETAFRLSSQESELYFEIRDAVREVDRMTPIQFEELSEKIRVCPPIARALAALKAQ